VVPAARHRTRDSARPARQAAHHRPADVVREPSGARPGIRAGARLRGIGPFGVLKLGGHRLEPGVDVADLRALELACSLQDLRAEAGERPAPRRPPTGIVTGTSTRPGRSASSRPRQAGPPGWGASPTRTTPARPPALWTTSLFRLARARRGEPFSPPLMLWQHHRVRPLRFCPAMSIRLSARPANRTTDTRIPSRRRSGIPRRPASPVTGPNPPMTTSTAIPLPIT